MEFSQDETFFPFRILNLFYIVMLLIAESRQALYPNRHITFPFSAIHLLIVIMIIENGVMKIKKQNGGNRTRWK